MKKVIFFALSMMLVSLNASAAFFGNFPAGGSDASTVLNGALLPLGIGGGLVYLAGNRDAKDLPGACYNEPVRIVKWKSAPGYSFEVAGCDYQAKKEKLIVVK